MTTSYVGPYPQHKHIDFLTIPIRPTTLASARPAESSSALTASMAVPPSGTVHLSVPSSYSDICSEIFTEMLASISTPIPACIDTLLAHITLDPQFTTFFRWAKAHDIPVSTWVQNLAKRDSDFR